MFKKAFCVVLLSIVASAPAEEYPPQPYSFSFDSTDEFGTRLTREETSDANNFKTGSYSYTDANGVSRLVKYTADADGFHVTIETNEPGTKSSNPADAVFTSSAVEDASAPNPLEVKITVPKPVVVQAEPATVALQETPVAVQAAPVAVQAAPVAVHDGPLAQPALTIVAVHPAHATEAKSA